MGLWRTFSGLSPGQTSLRLFAVALPLRLLALTVWGNISQPQLWEHGVIVRNLLGGRGYSLSYPGAGGEFVVPSAYMPPGYVAFLTPFLWLFGDNPAAYLIVLIVQSVLSALAAVLLYRVSLKVLPPSAALVSGLICACYPPFLYAAADFGTTTLYCAMLGCLMLLFLRVAEQPGAAAAVGAGLVGAALALVRGEGLFIVAALSVWLFTRTRYALLVPVGLLLGISPWVARNYAVFGTAVPVTTSFGFNFWRGHNDLASGTGREESGRGIWGSDAIDTGLARIAPSAGYERDRDRVFLEDAWSFVRDHPVKELMLGVKKFLYLWLLDLTHPLARTLPYAASWGALLLLFLAGVRECLQRGYPIGMLLTFAAGMTLTCVLFFVLPRYQMILAYGLIPVSAAGVLRIAGQFQAVRASRRAAGTPHQTDARTDQ